jgi:hypothetical protein
MVGEEGYPCNNIKHTMWQLILGYTVIVHLLAAYTLKRPVS